VLDAPTFSDVAAEFAELLQDRVFAAHNASFDLRFLQAEFERAGYWLGGGTPHVCKMTLGSRFGLGGSCSLSHACTTYGIDIGHAHSAGADSPPPRDCWRLSTLQSNTRPEWLDYWQQAAGPGAYSYPPGRRTGVAVKVRSDVGAAPVSFLERISTDAQRPRVEGARPNTSLCSTVA
jgi:DNA polymerase-3 subunit epsilon